MSQLKQPIFLKKIKKVINTIPGLEEQIFACRNKKRSDNPLLFIDRKDEERILMSRLQSQQKNEELASKLESLFHGNELSSPHSILCFIYWRYTKKIYRLSEDIISDVANTYVDNIPAQIGFAPIFPDTCYHLTHYWLAAVDIPVASDNPVHYADA
ncbi:hypothetical protein N7252_20670, partial [Escherichia coli]|nr:hypothetical protein [Escherichia coli]